MSQRMLVEVISRSNHTNTILRSVFNDVTRKSNCCIILMCISNYVSLNNMLVSISRLISTLTNSLTILVSTIILILVLIWTENATSIILIQCLLMLAEYLMFSVQYHTITVSFSTLLGLLFLNTVLISTLMSIWLIGFHHMIQYPTVLSPVMMRACVSDVMLQCAC